MSAYVRKTPKKDANLKRKHPYMNSANWFNGSFCFWRQRIPGALTGYATELYEERLRELMKAEKCLANFQSNIGQH